MVLAEILVICQQLNIGDLDSLIAYRAEALSRDLTVTELNTLLKSLRNYLYRLAILPHRLTQFKQRPITIEALGLKVSHELALKQANIETVGQFLAHEKKLTWPETELLAARIRLLVLLMVWAERAEPPPIDKPIQPRLPMEVIATHAVEAHHDITLLELSVRPFNTLKRAKIDTIEQLVKLSELDLLAVRNLGANSLAEIKEKLANYLATHSWEMPLAPVEIVPVDIQTEIKPVIIEEPSQTVTPIDVLDLSKRAYNCLYRARIVTVEQLIVSLKNDAKLLEVRNLGKQTLAEIHQKLADYQKRPPALPIAEITVTAEAKPSPTIIEPAASYVYPKPTVITEESQITVAWLAEQWFAQLTKRELQVIQWRYGLDGETLTLSQVGERLRLTRERARQVQIKALRKLNKIEAICCMQPIMNVINSIFAQNDNIVHETELVEAIKQAMPIGPIQLSAVIALLLDLQEDVIWNKKLGLWIRGQAKLADEIITVQATLFDLVEQNHVSLAVSDLVNRFKTTKCYTNPQYPLSDKFILTCLQASSALVVDDDTVSLEKWTRNGLNEIILALRELGEPSHFEAITTYTNKHLAPDEQITPHNVHAKMGRMTEVFVRVGHGVFGLKEWELHDDNNLGEAAYRVLKNAGQPLHQKVITAEVLKTWQAGKTSVNAALMANKDMFMLFGEGVFSLVEWERARSHEVEPQLPFCGLLLPDRVKHKDTLLESILVAQTYLKQRPRISDFLSYMLQWAGQDTAMSEWQKQSILNNYYLVGLIPYTFHFTGDNSPLSSTLPDLKPTELRDYCLQNLTRRLAAMPEFWWAIQSYKSSTATDLATYFAPYYPLNDIANRLKLLANLEVMKFLPDRRYQLTSFGRSVAAQWSAQPQTVATVEDNPSLVEYESWENDIELW